MKNSPIKQDRKFSLNILIIEDDPSLTEILGELFTGDGHKFRSYSSVIDILPVVEESVPDLVLLDYMLPDVNGGELCCQIKNHKDFNKIPVIIYSAFPKVLLSLGDYGCDVFLEKPFDLDVLVRKITELTVQQHTIA